MSLLVDPFAYTGWMFVALMAVGSVFLVDIHSHSRGGAVKKAVFPFNFLENFVVWVLETCFGGEKPGQFNHYTSWLFKWCMCIFLIIIWIFSTTVFNTMNLSSATPTIDPSCNALGGTGTVTASTFQGIAVFAFVKYTIFFIGLLLSMGLKIYHESNTYWFQPVTNKLASVAFALVFILDVILSFCWTSGLFGLRSMYGISPEIGAWSILATTAYSMLMVAFIHYVLTLSDDVKKDKFVAVESMTSDFHDIQVVSMKISNYILGAYVAMDLYINVLFFQDTSRTLTYLFICVLLPLVGCAYARQNTFYFYFHVICAAFFWSTFWIFYGFLPGLVDPAANFFIPNVNSEYIFYLSTWCAPNNYDTGDVLSTLYALPILAIVFCGFRFFEYWGSSDMVDDMARVNPFNKEK